MSYPLTDDVVTDARPAESRSNLAFAWGWICGFLIAVLLAWMFIQASDQAIPPCTDEIANNGGICQGPLVEDSAPTIPTPQLTAEPAAAVPSPEPTPELPPVQYWEDGSWRDPVTGETGCLPDGLCLDGGTVASEPSR